MKKQSIVATLGLAALVGVTVHAADREQLQMMADIRMLQEQAQQLHLLLGSISDAIEVLSARIDQQSESTRKAFADQKLGVDGLTNDLRVVREKVDDNNVRVGSLGQELDALRQSVMQLSVAVTTLPVSAPELGTETASAETPSPAPLEPTAPAPLPVDTPPPAAVGASPQRMWDLAFTDYTAGQYDLAILSYEGFIRSFPTDDRADNAQVLVANSYILAGDYEKAIEAADTAIRNYPNGDAIPEAYYRKGLALTNLHETEAAREAFRHIVTTYPNSDVAILAQQQLNTP